MRALCAAARRAASTEPLAFIVTARGAWHRVDMRHSAGVAGATLTRWCEPAIVGVVNMTRGFRALVSLSVFRLSSNLAGWRTLTPQVQVRFLAGELRNMRAHVWV